MAMRGRPLDALTLRRIQRMAEVASIKEIARSLGLSKNTVKKYLRGPAYTR